MEDFFALILWALFLWLAGLFADKRGRGMGSWIALSIFITPFVSFILLLILPVKTGEGTGYKTCKHCGNAIKSVALRCQYCHADVE